MKRKNLNIHEVVLIKKHLQKGEKQVEIAKQFGVSKLVVGKIKRGESWAEVDVAAYDTLQLKMKNDEKYQAIISSRENRIKSKQLSTESVADIKYILLKKYMSEVDIAQLFDVSRKTINNIANGTQFSHIQLDKHGNYIDEERIQHLKRLEQIAKTVPPVPQIKPHIKQVKVLTVEEVNILNIKNEFSSNLWELIKVKQGKTTQGKIRCTNEWFEAFLDNQWSTKYFSLSRDEFLAQAAYIVHKAILKFNPPDGFNWDGLLINSTSELNQIFAYLMVILKSDMIRHRNWFDQVDSIARQNTVDGKTTNYTEYIKFNFTSLNGKKNNKDGESTEIGLLQGEDADYFSSKKGYMEEPFLKWYKGNKEHLLTFNQIETMAVLQARESDKLQGVKLRDFELFDVVGSNVRKTKFVIKKKIEEAWAKEEQFTRSKIQINQKIAVLNGFVRMIEDEDIEPFEMNSKLSNFILSRLDSPFMHDMIYNNLTGFDLFNVTGAYPTGEIANQTLYKLTDIFYSKLEELERVNTTVRAFYRKPSEYSSNGQVISMDVYRELNKANKKKPNDDRTYKASEMTTYGVTKNDGELFE